MVFTRKYLLGLILIHSYSYAAPLVSPTNIPLENGINFALKPNLMFVLDDSGSMLRDYSGDEANDNLCKSVKKITDKKGNVSYTTSLFSKVCSSSSNSTYMNNETATPDVFYPNKP